MENQNGYSEAFMDFFSFRHTNPNNENQEFGYSKEVAAYNFIQENADYPGQDLFELQKTGNYEVLVPVNFKRKDKVLPKLCRTAAALYSLDMNDKIAVQKVERHDACNTNPFKITCSVNNAEKVFYLKKPDTRRAIGKAFYNILSNGKFVTYKFNENGFAADAVPGKEIEDNEKDSLAENRHFVEELVRLNVFTNLFMLDDILKQTNSNCAYSRKNGICLFDFDGFFREGSYHVLSNFKKIREMIDIKSIEKDEKFMIHQNLRKNRSMIEKLITAASENIEETENLAWSRDEDDIGGLLRKELSKIGEWSNKNCQ